MTQPAYWMMYHQLAGIALVSHLATIDDLADWLFENCDPNDYQTYSDFILDHYDSVSCLLKSIRLAKRDAISMEIN